MTQALRPENKFTLHIVMCCALLAACAPATTAPQDATASNASQNAKGPADAAPGTCWDKTETPAIIETVSAQVLISPAEISADGIIREPARYKKEDRQVIVKPRQQNWYQLVCAEEMTPKFVATLQRALLARGHYNGDITGQLDTVTRDAIARFQSEQNLPGFNLTMRAAEKLGLVAVARTQ